MNLVGFRDLGHASAQLNMVWVLHTPSSHATKPKRSALAASLVSVTKRAALRKAAGPGYAGSVHVIGHAE